MKERPNNQHGGARPNSGHPKGEEKKAIGLRVPVKYHAHLLQMIHAELARLKHP